MGRQVEVSWDHRSQPRASPAGPSRPLATGPKRHPKAASTPRPRTWSGRRRFASNGSSPPLRRRDDGLAHMDRAAPTETEEPVSVDVLRERGRRFHGRAGRASDALEHARECVRAGACRAGRLMTSNGRVMPTSRQTSVEHLERARAEADNPRRGLRSRGLLPQARAPAPSRRARARTSRTPARRVAGPCPVPIAIEISRRPSMPSTRASASDPAASSASTAVREMNVTP